MSRPKRELNSRPLDLESTALPTELLSRDVLRFIVCNTEAILVLSWLCLRRALAVSMFHYPLPSRDLHRSIIIKLFGGEMLSIGADEDSFNQSNQVITQKRSVRYNLPGKSKIVPRSHFRLHVCLLYTSPSPRDLSTSRMPSSA